MAPQAAASDVAEIEKLSKTGVTLPPDVAARFPLEEQRVRDDMGINVLVDLSHQANFFTMWRLPDALRKHGFRACGSQAVLDTVLQPGSLCRVRIHLEGKRRPFAWWPAVRFNVVFTLQADPKSQEYLPEEIETLMTFVRSGGGLVLVGGRVRNEDALKIWPLSRLAREFGASFSTEGDSLGKTRALALKLDSTWKPQVVGIKGKPLVARRELGKGRIVLISSSGMIDLRDRGASRDEIAAKEKLIADSVRWAAGGAPPVGGSRRLPRERAGGGPIYPEREMRIGNVVVYYAKNQKKELLNAVEHDMPLAKQKIEQWLPSVPPDEPMYLIVSAGGGGGWAVNAYLPKETGVISLTTQGLLSVFGHELAHTMGGPPNAKGHLAGHWPHGNQGESHAGWFQGKINALFGGKTDEANRNANSIFRWDKQGNALDLAMEPEALRDKWDKGKEWNKIWYVWQKLDDRYGPTWYPRWRWVQHTRWQDQPDRHLTWDETVEDMSIAVGEDLFPFFRKIGTSLTKDRFPRVVFQGNTIELPVAPIDVTPAGPVCLDPIGDYRKSVAPK
ncbi:hypothetical protein AMJ85_03010 [candidate division BRC1 bacterium SM23_51]|nr:MAG: hypothetical protein AMJ85_03010 [candidate division BRC1 bacterium SM23_51]